MLAAEAFSPDSGSAPAAEIIWRSDRDGPVGNGRRIRFSSLTAGTHTVSASVADGCGGESTARIPITVAPRVRPGRSRHNGTSKGHRHDRSR